MVHFIRFDAARRKIPHEIGGSTTLRIGNRVYVLTGVLVHEGESATSGHYYCDVVCPPHEQTGLAYQCNDAAYPSLIEAMRLLQLLIPWGQTPARGRVERSCHHRLPTKQRSSKGGVGCRPM